MKARVNCFCSSVAVDNDHLGNHGTFDFENIETENEFVPKDGRLFTASINNGNLTIKIVYQEETARGEFGTYEFLMSH